jgi:predicted alpha-1,2-mannosidase
MIRYKYFSLIVFAAFATSNAYSQNKPADYVNVFTGTSNSRWQMFPGSTMPFGMVKLSPDNQGNVWNGGYEYTIGSISGFSHLHAMGLSGLSIMPTTGSPYANEGWIKSFPGTADGPFGGMWTAGYRSRYKKETEHGSPGYYSVDLLDYNIKAELTSTMRCGMMRFTYPQTSQAHLILNFNSPSEEKNEILETHLEQVSATEVKGFIREKNGYVPHYTVYFVLQLSKPLKSIDAWQAASYTGSETNYGTQWRQKSSVLKGIKIFNGKDENGVILNFATNAHEAVVVRTGISFVSMDQAKKNLDSEMAPYNFDFNKVVAANKAVWNKLLGVVEVSGKNKDDIAKFYTNFYRAYTGKSVMNDVDGKYLDACGNVQQLYGKNKAVYSSDALWGTQWDLTPVWTLLTPEVAENWVNALLELADKGGWIPYAPVGLGYSPIMGAQHQNILIISSYQKGIRGFDAEKAYKAILHDYTTPGQDYACGGFAGNRHLKSYQDLGYVSNEAGPASNTMEYAYDDWCFAEFAKALGHKDSYEIFLKRSNNYKNIFDTTIRYVRQRNADGKWVEPFEPFKYGTIGGWNGKGFMEGTSFQYSFFVPQNVASVIKIMGRDTFVNRLEFGFKNNLFDLGNEPCLETPFLFSYAGKPWLTQYYTRKITKTMFDTSPYGGWVGEEDEDQLGAYYVLLSMGLFEVDGGCATKPFYNLTTPVFDKIVIHLDKRFYKGKTFTIITKSNRLNNNYIQSASLNGKPLDRAYLFHQELVDGGTLTYVLGKAPNKKWGLKQLPSEQ